ncbi:uracil-DNA glycosylase [Aquibacillus kalidii]|uniref:uracil-DNA glycosylase n=1 Tax=Aquibacillus kalidii TaxID=2762597 RepID=UPI00164554A7|nr:uracil-DNA glycosylase [Aquibacillus kalidii]
MIIPSNIHPTWKPLFTKDLINELTLIESKLGENYNPKKEQILRFLTTDLSKVKVIWLGQDVYPAKGVATGRSFEVGSLSDWSQPFRQVSVKNIIRLVHKSYFKIEKYGEIKSFSEIKGDIANSKFPILRPDKWFDSLEKQGVLFLNTSFTCEIGKANSHKDLWKNFSKEVLSFISKNYPSVQWFLWGKEAKESKSYIKSGIFYESRHPMMCSAKYEDDFLKSDCFVNTWDVINWVGN